MTAELERPKNEISFRPLALVDDLLIREVNNAPLVVFRIIFGFLMFGSTLRFVLLGWVEDHYITPSFHFHYFGFSWVEPLPAFWMYAVHFLMMAAALGICMGFLYRASAVTFFLLFTYTELIDLTYYLNHYYFVSLAAGLMILVPAHKRFSIDVWLNRAAYQKTCPRWAIVIFQLQLSIVYIYAGWAKINYDWLINAMPLKIWLPAHHHLPLIGPLLQKEVTAYVFSWAGMLYDSFIPFFLLYRPSRKLAYLAVIGFHAMTGLLFQIGVFPVVMIGLTLVFFSAEFHEKIIDKLSKALQLLGLRNSSELVQVVRISTSTSMKFQKPIVYFLYAFFAFQLLFPWRYLLYDGNLFWNEEGYRFSWRVMLMEKAGTATFYVKDPEKGWEISIDNREFLNAHQEKQMAFQPDMLLQFANYLDGVYRKKGVSDPEVRIEAWVTLNGRPSQLLIDPKVDLSGIEDGFRQKNWVSLYPY